MRRDSGTDQAQEYSVRLLPAEGGDRTDGKKEGASGAITI